MMTSTFYLLERTAMNKSTKFVSLLACMNTNVLDFVETFGNATCLDMFVRSMMTMSDNGFGWLSDRSRRNSRGSNREGDEADQCNEE